MCLGSADRGELGKPHGAARGRKGKGRGGLRDVRGSREDKGGRGEAWREGAMGGAV
jgi:hypothetical protein